MQICISSLERCWSRHANLLDKAVHPIFHWTRSLGKYIQLPKTSLEWLKLNLRGPGGSTGLHCAVECVVVSQNEFWDSALAYFNVFFNFGVGSFSSTFEFGRFLWLKMGFQNSYFAIKVKISKCSKQTNKHPVEHTVFRVASGFFLVRVWPPACL